MDLVTRDGESRSWINIVDKFSAAAFDFLCLLCSVGVVVFLVRLHLGTKQISQSGSQSVVNGLRTILAGTVWLLPLVLLYLLLFLH